MTNTSDGRPATHRLDDPLLRVEGVSAGYDATTVLQNVGFDVGRGEVVGIVGRNGVGKTTTLRTIMGNLAPRSGSITYDGVDIAGMGPEATVAEGIALVPEERRVFDSLSVRENLELAELGGSGGGRSIEDVLATFENLAEREHAPGSALSGGEQQMLAIARALVSGADCLLLDEPTEGLAPLIVERVIDVVRELRADGLTVLLVEQNVHVALDVCDYVYVVANGQVVHGSPADELRADGEVLDRHLGVGQ
ncbi:ABC transporter ATP-binding protein [Haloarcula marina]|uniref:ABC transporter ATP-binding protein n=1 Tax=Haloarcula marina TaxID=2961574 RepID=UPI0020B691C8|nr:ABC transporter ATP-binding protein [Halomicroarcula marina]